MTIIWLESQLWVASCWPVMPSMILALMVSATAYARQIAVTLSHPGIESRLGSLHPVTERLNFHLALSVLRRRLPGCQSLRLLTRKLYRA